MKKESRDIATAFHERRPCKRQRTSTNGDQVYLHGNIIAWREPNGSRVLTLAGWGTVTTRDRLNAICDAFGRGRPFSQRAGQQFFGDNQISVNEEIPLNPEPGWRSTLEQWIMDDKGHIIPLSEWE